MPLILPRRNPLVYPAGAVPGFDPSHIAANGTFISVCGIPSGCVADLLHSSQPTLAGAAVPQTHGIIGPGIYTGPSASDWATVPYVSMGAVSQATAAAIFTMNSFSGFRIQLAVTGPSGTIFAQGNAIQGSVNFVGTFVPVTLPAILPGVPYFFACSNNATVTNMVLVRLDTGQTWTEVGGVLVGQALNSPAFIGSRNAARGTDGITSAAMAAVTYLTMGQLQQWARDPWSFWYPRAQTIKQKQIPALPGGVRFRPRVNQTRNALTYPSGVAPGFDPSHVALSAGQPVLSAITTGAGMLPLSAASTFVLSGSSTISTDGRVGPVVEVDITGSGNSGALTPGVSFAGGTPWAVGTVGVIFRTGSAAAGPNSFGCIVHLKCAGFSLHTNFGGADNLELAQPQGGADAASGLAIAANTPYFAAVSFSTPLNNVNFVLVNLRTGAISRATGIAPPTLGGSGGGINNVLIGNDGNGNTPLGGGVACLAAQNSYASLQQLLIWAQDPWSFWYPRRAVQYNTPKTPVISGARVKQRWNRNDLVYPAGAKPGFDPSHVASPNLFFSGVSNVGNFINLLTGESGTIANGPLTFTLDGHVGFGMGATGGSLSSTQFPGVSGVQSTATIAGIGILTNVTGNQLLLGTDQSGASGGVQFRSTAGVLTVVFSASTNPSSSGITLSANVPYFLAASFSFSANIINYVAVNLLTGAVQTSVGTVSANSVAAALPAICLGSTSITTSRPWIGALATAMFSQGFLSQQQLLQWAQDPWAFWYPRKLETKIAIDAPAPVVSSGSIFAQAVSAISASVTSIRKAVGKIVPVASATATSFLKSVGKTVSATSTSATSFVKSVGKHIAATCSGTVSQIKNIGKIIAVTCTGVVSAVKSVAKSVLVTCISTVTTTAIKVKIVIVSAASTSAVVLKRAIGKPLAITSASAVSALRAITRTLAVTSTTATSVAKSISKIVRATASTIVAITYNIGTGGHFVYNVMISATSTTLTRWLAGFFKAAGPESVSRTDNAEANRRSSDWPSTPRN